VAEGPVERIVRQSGVPELVEILADRMAPTDLQSLLLEVYRRRTASISAADLLTGYGQNRFTRPATLDPTALAWFEQRVWSLLPPGYQGLDLSPLCPIGTSSVMATVDQNKVISTARNTEVVSDSTNVLALECAVRRRGLLRQGGSRFQPVRLAASQRQVRAQAFSGPLEWSHFRIVGLVAAGRDEGAFAFEGAPSGTRSGTSWPFWVRSARVANRCRHDRPRRSHRDPGPRRPGATADPVPRRHASDGSRPSVGPRLLRRRVLQAVRH
jgi:hypothetical protein